MKIPSSSLVLLLGLVLSTSGLAQSIEETAIADSRTHQAQNDNKAAVEILERAIAAGGNTSSLFSEYGVALANRMREVQFLQGILAGKMKRAFEKAVQLDPNNLTAWTGLAEYYSNAPAFAGGSVERAIKCAQEVQTRDALRGNLELGQIYRRAGKLDQAREAFSAALKIDPSSQTATEGIKALDTPKL